MNLKYTTLVLSSISVFCFAQVGIGTTDPKATLDIRAKDDLADTKNLSINTESNLLNSSNKELLTIYNDGRTNVGGLFKPNGNEGLPGQFLVSNGPNLPPIWTNLTSNVLINAFQIYFNLYDGQSFSSGSTVLVEFNLDEENGKSKIFSDSTLGIGVWEDPSYFKILQSGSYLVSWNVKLGFGEYDINVPLSSNPISRLKYGADKSQLNSYIVSVVPSICRKLNCDQFYINDPVKIANLGGAVLLKLEVNDYIAIDVTAFQRSENSTRDINILTSDISIQKIGL